jgi:hypothetical protein
MTTTHRLTDIERRRTAAYWYAAGIADGSGAPDRSDDFANFARAEAEAYANGETFHLPSIMDQWKRFSDG